MDTLNIISDSKRCANNSDFIAICSASYLKAYLLTLCPFQLGSDLPGGWGSC